MENDALNRELLRSDCIDAEILRYLVQPQQNFKQMKSYLIYTAIGIGIIAIFAVYTFEFQYFNRTLHMRTLAVLAMIVGAGAGAGVAFRLQRLATDWLERVQIFVGCIFAAIILMPLLASLSNRLLSFRATKNIAVEFVEEEPYYGSRFGIRSADGQAKPSHYRSFIYRDRDLLKIQTRNALFPDASRGDTVLLPIKKGRWGFEFVPK